MAPRKGKKKGTKAKVSAPVKGPQGHKDICFIMCPFGGWNDRYCEEIFEPAVESAGMEAKRADDMYRPSAIVHDIWEYVKKSRVMLAELTGKNPNVLYELGLAHATGKPVIMVTQSMEDVPFDLRSLRVLTYDVENPAWSTILRDSVKRALEEVLSAPELAVPPAFLHVRKGGKQPSVSPIKRKLLELEQQVDLLRVQRRGRIELPLRASEAEALIRNYVREGAPRGYIVDKLASSGAPIDWIERRIDELIRDRRSSEPARVESPLGGQPAATSAAESKQGEEKKPT
jgi:hypothetical protein